MPKNFYSGIWPFLEIHTLNIYKQWKNIRLYGQKRVYFLAKEGEAVVNICPQEWKLFPQNSEFLQLFPEPKVSGYITFQNINKIPKFLNWEPCTAGFTFAHNTCVSLEVHVFVFWKHVQWCFRPIKNKNPSPNFRFP